MNSYSIFLYFNVIKWMFNYVTNLKRTIEHPVFQYQETYDL